VIGRHGRKYSWARIVVEYLLGRSLDPDEHVHHVNGDRGDDREENLQVIDPSTHARQHAIEQESWRRLAAAPRAPITEDFRARMRENGRLGADGTQRPLVCSVDGCENKHWGRGMCQMHYTRARRAAMV
jgi:hypothetical protein